MTKSRAEYQREYRERKKEKDPNYLNSERIRAKGNRVSISKKSKREQSAIRHRNKEYSKRYRAKLKIKSTLNKPIKNQSSQELISEQVPTVSSSTDTCITVEQCQENQSQTTLLQKMTVKLNFKRKNQARRKRSKCLRQASYKVCSLMNKVNELKREKKTLQRRFQRLKESKRKPITSAGMPSVQSDDKGNQMTPRSQTKHDLNILGIKSRSRKVVKKLVMSNAILAEVRDAVQKTKSQSERGVIMRVISGKILKKYKCLDTVRKQTGLGRKGMSKTNTKQVNPILRKRLEKERNMIKTKVIQFMERDDVSIQMPGKKDCKTYEGEQRQVRILNDYLGNIYEKYKAENPTEKLSKSVFSRFRPTYILLTNLISRNTCLCSKHQNFAMKLKAMRSAKLEISPNPETVGKTINMDEMMDILSKLDDSEKVTFEKWQRVNDDDGKKRMKIVKVEMEKVEFQNMMRNEYEDFLGHVGRVRSQYEALKQLKANLPPNHVIVNMDFAENFTCGNMDEIQSAYWNAASVTLHPVVVYYKDDSDELKHKNYIFISDVGNHNATAVYTILKGLVPCIKEMLPSTTMVHYWTDSPSSQYRNRYIFNLLTKHKELFGTEARWNYYECGHGKGPCDGLGGVAKRQAGNACKQGRATIQNAKDFFKWAKANQKSIEYKFYSQTEYDNSATELNEDRSKAIPGTMKLHAIIHVRNQFYTATTSCYCARCLANDPCMHWETVQNNKPENETSNGKKHVPAVGTFVLAKYDRKKYVGKVLEVDCNSKDAHVSFMEKTRGKGPMPLFRWPSRADDLWVNFEDIISTIEEPSPYGKTKRQYRLNNDDVALIADD